MPEYPDIVVYIERLNTLLAGTKLEGVRIKSPFLVRTADPPIRATVGMGILGFRRMGKRIVFAFEEELFWVLHLMIAGRLHWKPRGAAISGKIALAAFDFTHGTLLLTEASTKKRASLHVVRGEKGLMAFDRGGLEVMAAREGDFSRALRLENHTLKRALTDPRLFSAIGNAYSDEILHRAKLSPVRLSQTLSDEEARRLFQATQETLSHWAGKLRSEVKEGLPEKVTAFRLDMAVHGKFREPCPVCGTKVQRIVYADNETNYCPTCQTEGKLLADRSLSRLLKKDWPKTLTALEEQLNLTRPPRQG